MGFVTALFLVVTHVPVVLPRQLHFAARGAIRDASAGAETLPENCWWACGERSGFCDFCGAALACCREAWPDDAPECLKATGHLVDYHECVPTSATQQTVGPAELSAEEEFQRQQEASLLRTLQAEEDARRRAEEELERRVQQVIGRKAEIDSAKKESALGEKKQAVALQEEVVRHVLPEQTLALAASAPADDAAAAAADVEAERSSEEQHGEREEAVADAVAGVEVGVEAVAEAEAETVAVPVAEGEVEAETEAVPVAEFEREAEAEAEVPAAGEGVAESDAVAVALAPPEPVEEAAPANKVAAAGEDVAEPEALAKAVANIETVEEDGAAWKKAPARWAFDDVKSSEAMDAEGQDSFNVSVFIAIFSKRSGNFRRNTTRALWRRARDLSGPGVTVKYAVCKRPARGELAWVGDNLQDESRREDDLLLLDCREGLGGDLLTRKLLAVMTEYLAHYRNSYFFKLEDDTFVAWERYATWLRSRGSPDLYMGVDIAQARPCRDEGYSLYEPFSTFPDVVYPRGMSGGTGYTLGRDLVQSVLRTGVGHAKFLYNEDRSVSVWMDLLARSGTKVDYVGYPGADGDWGYPRKDFTTWGKYPLVVHHGLEVQTIKCLARRSAAHRSEAKIAPCFKHEEGKVYKKSVCGAKNSDSA